jgi:FKBP-type peptidyl-prolyl cis-trans isomerase SlyD
MKIEPNAIATICYEVRERETGTLLQHIPCDRPEQFLFGHGLLIDAFEQNLQGLTSGALFRFTVDCNNAYGPVDPSAVFDLPVSTFADEDGTIDESIVKTGHVFPMADKNGNRHFGKIIRIMEGRVTMDFNHPLAGKNLIFSGSIISIRLAEAHEIKEILSHDQKL